MTESYFLWPKSKRFSVLKSVHRLVSVEMVEKKLNSLFPSGFPVLCSSGRAALAISLIESEVTRSDLVGVFPYASHCVLDVVSRITTPLAGPTSTSTNLRIVYHQWGFVQEIDLEPNTIEDCADSLCMPGSVLFPGGGRFEIWSLPKILGTSSGGILWCRDIETATAARRCRDSRGGGLIPFMIKLLSAWYPKAYLYWQGVEGNMGRLSSLQTGEIIMAIESWEKIISKRINNLNRVWPYAVDWLNKPDKRLPPVIPISPILTEKSCHEHGISSGHRTFEKLDSSGVRSLEKVLPIPIHQDVNEIWLIKLLERISNGE